LLKLESFTIKIIFNIEHRTSNLAAFRTAAGSGVLAFDPGLNNIGGAAHPRSHRDRI
jgi:hypothetical protein